MSGAREDSDGLLLDELQEQLARTRNLLADGPEGAANAVLARLGRRTADESHLVAQLAEDAPLARPDAFEQAHRLVMRALEIHDRDGWRRPPVARLGPLSGVAGALAELVARVIVRTYTADVSHTLARLYARREAQSAIASSERRLLARARIQTERVAGGYRGGTSGLPTIVAGGAAVPVLAAVLRPLGGLNWLSLPIQVAIGVLLFGLFALLAYVLLQGAATARRRGQLLLDQPLVALWQTIGRCGHPPRDQATTVAAVSIVLTFLAWFVAPAVVTAFLIWLR